MDDKVTWSQESLDDLDALAEYISKDSLSYAQQVIERLFELGDQLVLQPRMGRVVPELGDDSLRELFVYQYRVIYEVKESEFVNILAVLHGARQFRIIQERFIDD